jgi:hypothetical protein
MQQGGLVCSAQPGMSCTVAFDSMEGIPQTKPLSSLMGDKEREGRTGQKEKKRGGEKVRESDEVK